jgi:3-oxoacyl-[acyl-carrier protein] reductase
VVAGAAGTAFRAGRLLALPPEADLADAEAPRAVVAAARSVYGHVDLLVVNHARSGHGRLADVTARELDAFFAQPGEEVTWGGSISAAAASSPPSGSPR